VSLSDRIDRLDARERQLLGALVAVFLAIVVLLVPIGFQALVHSRRSETEELRKAVAAIQENRELVRKHNEEREVVLARYAQPAPPLAGFLDKLAKESSLEIPESQDRAPVPHGKKFEERSTKIVLRKVGLLNLSKFMERIEQSGHPVSISRLNIRKRGTEQDSYDVEMFVSAFVRQPDTKESKGSGASEPGQPEAEP
jgi:general secretion pathway protein M